MGIICPTTTLWNKVDLSGKMGGRGDPPDSAGPAMRAKCCSDVKWHTYTEIIYFSCPITCKS